MIRRPLLFAAMGQAAGIFVGYCFSRWISAACVLCAAGLLLYMQRQPGRVRKIMSLTAAAFVMGCFCFWGWSGVLQRQEDSLAGRNTIRGKVTDTEKKLNQKGEEYTRLTVKTDSGKILVSCYGEILKGTPVPGSIVQADGNAEQPACRRNPGCFDYRLYLKSIGITAVMRADKLTIIRESESPAGRLFILKESFAERIEEICGSDTSAMIKAILFGDKGELDSDMLEVFQRNGTAHILAVSGLHIGIIYGFLLKMWRGRRGWIFFGFTCVFFFCYAVMAGFSPSVIRAVIMIILHSLASLMGRRYDLDSAAFAVAAGVLAVRPFMLFNAGFQMSFLAVLTLNLALPYIKSFYSGVFTASLAVQLGLGPFIWYNFNYVSMLAVIMNVPVVFLAGIIVPAGLAGLLLQNTPLFEVSARLLDFLCNFLTQINELGEIQGIITFQVPSPPIWIVAAFYLGLVAFASEEGRLAVIRAANPVMHIVKYSAVVVAVSLMLAVAAGSGFNNCSITFVDVGQGDCICVNTGGGVYLFDGGGSENYNLGKSTLRPYLLKNGTGTVDGAFVTHLHTDHYRGICELAREGMVEKLYTYEANRLVQDEIVRDTGLQPENIMYLHGGQIAELKGCCSVEILWPGAKSEREYMEMLSREENENDLSLVMKINVQGIGILITGDIDEIGERMVIEAGREALSADILKVAHHGSKYSSCDEFIEAVSPEIAVIQVGKNNYGHPAPDVLQRLEKRSVPVYRNDLDGAVGVEINDGEIRETRRMIE
ncbi:MAG: DNA internalization-related competence protein ComEC/Rec2 [Lentihominibacter sp.]